jgi:hypothetical protein
LVSKTEKGGRLAPSFFFAPNLENPKLTSNLPCVNRATATLRDDSTVIVTGPKATKTKTSFFTWKQERDSAEARA